MLRNHPLVASKVIRFVSEKDPVQFAENGRDAVLLIVVKPGVDISIIPLGRDSELKYFGEYISPVVKIDS